MKNAKKKFNDMKDQNTHFPVKVPDQQAFFFAEMSFPLFKT